MFVHRRYLCYVTAPLLLVFRQVRWDGETSTVAGLPERRGGVTDGGVSTWPGKLSRTDYRNYRNLYINPVSALTIRKKLGDFLNTKMTKSDYISKLRIAQKISFMQKKERQVNSNLPCKFGHFWRKLNFWGTVCTVWAHKILYMSNLKIIWKYNFLKIKH